MKHYGDITQLHGNRLEPVDIIIGGSPCQNLSVAGNRQGLSGEQSETKQLQSCTKTETP